MADLIMSSVLSINASVDLLSSSLVTVNSMGMPFTSMTPLASSTLSNIILIFSASERILFLRSLFLSRSCGLMPDRSTTLFCMMDARCRSQSLPPRNLLPSLDLTVNPLSLTDMTVTSKVPPPMS